MITEEQMSQIDMQKVVNNGHTCGICGGQLTVAWGGAYGIKSYILRCGNDIKHDTINRHDKQREEQIKIIKEVRDMDSTALMKMDEAKMLQRIDMARFPQQVTIQEKKMLAQVAITYGFDPLMGELTVYQGRPYVSIDGRYRKAQETGELDGVESRPATKQEKTDREIPEGDFLYRAELWRKGSSHPFIAWGRVRKIEINKAQNSKGADFLPLALDPQRMAEKRAEAQALRKAFHIPLPSVEDIGSSDEEVFTTRVIDVTTGELNEAPQPESELSTATPQTTRKPAKAEAVGNHPVTPLTPEDKAKMEAYIQEHPPVIDMDWLRESLSQLQWTDVGKYLKEKYQVSGSKVSEIVLQLTPEQQNEFGAEVQKRLEAQKN